MAVNFGLVGNRHERRRGPKPFFSPEGKVALMFLKNYTQLSAPYGRTWLFPCLTSC